MVYKNLVMKDLQQEIVLRKKGIMMVVSLANKDELDILLDQSDKVTERFFTIVDIACHESIEYKIIRDSEPTKLYVFIPNNLKIASVRTAYITSAKLAIIPDVR